MKDASIILSLCWVDPADRIPVCVTRSKEALPLQSFQAAVPGEGMQCWRPSSSPSNHVTSSLLLVTHY